MQLFNSQSQTLERFRPRPGQAVGVYACGITPYDTTHLGHAFTYVVFDVLVRFLRTVHHWPVCYVQCVTDIDDDILRRATECATDWRQLGQVWTRRFTDDMARLNVTPPDRYPGATAYIGAIQAMVTELLRQDRAYQVGGNVYYRVKSDPDFAVMARLPYEELLRIAAERGTRTDDPNKLDPLDFVLWQGAAVGEPAWLSPWGPGRPGWHIECSAMAASLLGSPVDIQGGGADLLFPHHACCTTISEAVTGVRPWVRWWIHTAMVRKDGAKMSKSLGNLVLVDELLRATEPDQLRLYLLAHHYREAWEWSAEGLAQMAAEMQVLHAAMSRDPGNGPPLDPGVYGPRFTAALSDDLNTPAALQVVRELAEEILSARPNVSVSPAQDVLATLAGDVLGLWLRPYETVPEALRQKVVWPEPEAADPDGTYPFVKDDEQLATENVRDEPAES